MKCTHAGREVGAEGFEPHNPEKSMVNTDEAEKPRSNRRLQPFDPFCKGKAAERHEELQAPLDIPWHVCEKIRLQSVQVVSIINLANVLFSCRGESSGGAGPTSTVKLSRVTSRNMLHDVAGHTRSREASNSGS
jgi:hypothetical protein